MVLSVFTLAVKTPGSLGKLCFQVALLFSTFRMPSTLRASAVDADRAFRT